MGFFSSKKKLVVNTTVQQIFEDSPIPNSMQLGVIQSITKGTDIAGEILDAFTASIGIRADTGYNWAKRNNYYWGFPYSSVHSAIDARTVVKQTIEMSQGPITTLYNNFGLLNSLHWGFQYCRNTWNYNPSTNELVGLSAAKNSPVYLVDIVPVYTEDTATWNAQIATLGVLDNWGFSPRSGFAPSRPYTTLTGVGQYADQSPYEVDINAAEDYLKIFYEYVKPDGTIQSEVVTIPITVDLEEDYHQVRYTRADGTTGFFTYLQNAGTFPAIDDVFAADFSESGTYFPWAYMRYDGKNIDHFSTDVIWGQVKAWCQFLGVDAQMINDAVHEDENVDDVEQAILFFGVRPSTQDQSELQYLFKYMLRLHTASVTQRAKAQVIQDLLGDYSNSLDQKILIRDKFFKMSFSFSGIKYARKTGRVTGLGKYTGAFVTATNSSGQKQTSQPAYRYQYQVLSSVYEEITVFNPNLFYSIKSGKGHSAKPGAKELLFPVDRGVLNTISVKDKEVILTRSLHMCVNTVQEIKSSWYSGTFFRWIMIIVAVIITVYTAGAAWQSLVAAAAIGVTAVALVILQYTVLSMVANYAVKIFVKEVGPEFALIVAIAAMAVGAYGMSTDATWGQTLLSISSNLTKTAGTTYVNDLQASFANMANEMSWMQEQMDSLSETRKELGLGFEYSGLSGLDFVGYRPTLVMGESPTDFYSKTVHSGNVGASSMALTEMYFDVKLTLPQLHETINEDNENGLPV